MMILTIAKANVATIYLCNDFGVGKAKNTNKRNRICQILI